MSEMAVAPVLHGPFDGSLDRDRIAAYVHATGDQTPSVLGGLAVPAVFPVILVFTPNEAARGDLPDAAYQGARGGVHGEHDIVLHRPLIPGERLQTWSRISAVRTTRAGTQVVMQFEQMDPDGFVVVRQWWTMMLLGLQGVADLGMTPAEHRFPDEARAHPLGSVSQHIDGDVTRRYAELSGDWRPTISTSRWPAPRGSTSCSRTDCARWRSALTNFSASWGSMTRAWFGASRCDSHHPHPWTAT